MAREINDRVSRKHVTVKVVGVEGYLGLDRGKAGSGIFQGNHIDEGTHRHTSSVRHLFCMFLLHRKTGRLCKT